MPMVKPINPQPQTTQTETSSEIRAPYKVRERMSRPSSSVPIQCARDGDASLAGRFCAAGSAGAIQGANRAANNKMTALFAPWIAPADPAAQNLPARLASEY